MENSVAVTERTAISVAVERRLRIVGRARTGGATDLAEGQWCGAGCAQKSGNGRGDCSEQRCKKRGGKGIATQ